jgi:hypothetical protein
LDKAAKEGEFRNAITKLIESLRKRGYSAYDNGASAGGSIDRETEERIRNAAYQAGYAEGEKKGGLGQEMVERMRCAAYSEGYAEGQKCAVIDQNTHAMMNAYAAGYKVGCDEFFKGWVAKGKKALILTVAVVYVVASLSGGVWLFMPHGPEVRRATLVKLPPPHAHHYTKHHRAAVSGSMKHENS